MKQRIIRKSGQLFCSPILALEEITKQQAKQSSTKRYALSLLFKILCFITYRNYFYRKESEAFYVTTKEILVRESCT